MRPLRLLRLPTLLLSAILALAGCTFDGTGLGFIDALTQDSASDAPDLGPDGPPPDRAREGGGDQSRDGADGATDAATDAAVDASDAATDTTPDIEPDAPQPTCADSKKNGGETDIDCGGPTCSGCALGRACKLTSDCASPNLCTSKICAEPVSCAALHTARPGLPTANYAIKPSPANPAITTRCDMATNGGGWTLIMRTVWDWTDSQKLMTGYAALYGSGAGAITGAFRLPGKHWTALAAQKHLMLSAAPRTKAGSACGPLRYLASGTAASANAGLKELRFEGFGALLLWPELSTTDSGPSQSCSTYGGVPWFYKLCCAICPTLGGAYWSPARPMIILTQLQKPDQQGNTLAGVCGATEDSNGYVGIDTMEWYLR